MFILDWKEGQYTFLFQNDTKIEQFYFDDKFRRCGRTPQFRKCKAIKASWCSKYHVPMRLDYSERINATKSKKLEKEMSWNLNQISLNDDFLKCLEHHAKDSTNILERFSTYIKCVPNYCVESHNRTCRHLKFHQDSSAACSFTWNNQSEAGILDVKVNLTHWGKRKKQEVNLPGLRIRNADILVNLMCFIHDESYNRKYVFNQPIIAERRKPILKVRLGSQTSDGKSTPKYSDNTIHISMTFLIIAIALILSLAAGASIRYHHEKKSRYDSTRIIWERNELYHTTDESDTEETKNDDSIVPQWLTAKPEMIYQPGCIEKGPALGHGQYGTVYKGKLIQGNAV